MIRTVAVQGYRSLRDLVLPLGKLTVITGANGSGKSSVYRALRLLAASAQGRLIADLARDGGLSSVLYAGPEQGARAARRGHPVQGTTRTEVVALQLGYAGDELGYLVDLGVPLAGEKVFEHDADIKREVTFSAPVFRPASTLISRTRPRLVAHTGRSTRVINDAVPSYLSALSEFGDPDQTPEVLAVRWALKDWRFYDGFRVDPDAPARRPQVGTRTPVLSDDGSDLAAAIGTIMATGGARRFAAALDDAFPGSTVEIVGENGSVEVALRQPGLLRPIRSAELSDGTLRFLLWCTALLSERPPTLMVLNEPETSLHPDLLPALGRLISDASATTQIVVVSHSRALIEHLDVRPIAPASSGQGELAFDSDDLLDHDELRERCETGGIELELRKVGGETVVSGLSRMNTPLWDWGTR